ncbi:MAG: branched-chain amino acid ABC transporter permease [Bacillota bacterium]|nr:branched-chain amino acid ABC transporter permease [Bacillota bacterium]
MEYYISQIINGLAQGSIYALMAIGYSVVVGVVGLVTFTHGEVMVLGAYAAYYAFTYFGNNLLLGLFASFFASWFIGIFVYKICYERFFDAPRHISLICTIGVSMLLKNLAQIFFGPNMKAMPQPIALRFINLFGVRINTIQIIIVVIVLALSLGLYILNNKTRWGIQLRAVSQDKKASALMGINVKRTALIGNSIGCSLGGVAGMLLAIYYQSLVPTMGGTMGLKAFSSSVLGGLTEAPASALGGLLIGLTENLGTAVLSNSYRDVFAFIFLVLVLIIKPEGFSKKVGGKL